MKRGVVIGRCVPWEADRGHEPSEKRMGLEDEGAGAVAPDALQPELEPAVVTAQEAVLSQRRAGDVTAEPRAAAVAR